MHTRNVPQRGFNFEYLMWMFTRISALTLYALALTGLTVALVMGARQQMSLDALLRWAFVPNPNHVVNTDIPDIEAGWANAFWQIVQMLIVFFAATHGFNGLRIVIEDYINSAWLRPLLRGLLFLLWLFMLVLAVYVILAS